MKKEKQVRTYQRKTKSGKLVTVKAHTAKYDAAEKAKEMLKKKGAGNELDELKKKKGVQLELPFDEEDLEKKVEESVKETETPKKENKKHGGNKRENDAIKKHGLTKSEVKLLKENGYSIASGRWEDGGGKVDPKTALKDIKGYLKNKEGKKIKKTIGTGTNGPEPRQKKTTAKKAEPKESAMSFTRNDFREWYRGTGSEADKRVASILKKQLGRSGYKKLEDEAIDNYSSRGHLSMFKRVSSDSAKTPTKETKSGDKSSKEETTKKASKINSEKNTEWLKERKSRLTGRPVYSGDTKISGVKVRVEASRDKDGKLSVDVYDGHHDVIDSFRTATLSKIDDRLNKMFPSPSLHIRRSRKPSMMLGKRPLKEEATKKAPKKKK